MMRRLRLAILVLLSPLASAGQPLELLHISVTVAGDNQQPVPVPNHGLLISDDPPTTAPRRVVTRLDGTVDVRLRPGSYVVESDEPIAHRGSTYEWMQQVKITPGREGVLALTAANAEITAANATSGDGRSPKSDPALLLPPWQNSVVTLWTPTARAAGFVVDAEGVIATSYGAVSNATSIEVQLTPAVKVPGTAILADPGGDVVLLRIDPAALGAAKPLPLPCGGAPAPALVEGQRILSIAARLGEPGRIASGTINRADPGGVISDIDIGSDGLGGPVFDINGRVAGIASRPRGKDELRPGRHVIVRMEAVCTAMTAARPATEAAPAPPPTRLPVEPRNIPTAALAEAASARKASLSAYQTSTSDFEITFITPVLLFEARNRPGARGNAPRRTATPERLSDPLDDFSNWSEYVAGYPPVLLIRATPKLAESFWTTVARGVARTQGMSIPPIKRVKSSFARMRAYCGDVEVTPIHPFQLELRVSQTDALYEGLYAFERDALTPACGTVRLLLYSEKAPEEPVIRTIEPKLLEQVATDFAPYRARD